jgi:hypothetical protein
MIHIYSSSLISSTVLIVEDGAGSRKRSRREILGESGWVDRSFGRGALAERGETRNENYISRNEQRGRKKWQTGGQRKAFK